jgi:hypothetical protein
VLATLTDAPQTAEQIAAAAGDLQAVESIFLILEHLAANGRVQIAHLDRADGPMFSRGANVAR